MMARGFDGRSRTLDRLRFSRADAYFVASLGLTLIFISLFNLLY